MDKQTLRYTYLDYFRNQYTHNKPIESKVLIEMAPNGKTASEVLRELVAEELIEGIDFVDGDEKGLSLVTDEVVKLTEKGKNEINKMNFAQRLAEDTQKEEQNEKLIQTLIERERERISKLSDTAKEEEIKIKILEYFQFLNSEINKYENKQISDKELKEKIKKIISHYFSSNQLSYAKLITKNLFLEDYITYFIKNAKSADFVDISKLLTLKGKTFLKDLQKQEKAEIDKYYKEHNIKPIIDNLPIGTIKVYQSIANPALIAAMNQLPAIYSSINNFGLSSTINQLTQVQSTLNTPYVNNVLNNLKSPATEAAIKSARKGSSEILNSPPSGLYAKLIEKSEEKLETFTFEGILGRNCGTIAKYYGSEPRLLEKGFIVEEGTYVLRGYAKMSDLVGASIVDKKNYQRTEDIQHIKDIKDFLEKGKVLFLPEVVLVARNEVEIQEIDFNLKGKQLGQFKNINYRKIIVASKSLYRVDGNHRLEAYEENQKDYYIPFSIILWHFDEELEKSQEQQEKQKKNDIDNEAFLFYLLNAKSKPLTLEDNIRGIVKSDVDVWKDENIKDVNFIFPHLRGIYNDLNNDSLFKKSHYKDTNDNQNVWTQYLNILNEIFTKENKDKKLDEEYTISFNKEQCKEMVCNTLLLLNQTTRFKYLREHYKKFPQLVFYLYYLKFLDKENKINIENDLEDINAWAEKYKHDDNSFENPINMYENAMKQIQRDEINIFVAMPYYNKDCIKQFNINYEKVIAEIAKKKPKLKDRLKLFPIMEHTGETKNILSYIDNCINKCQIFIADVSDDPAKNNIVNPNVMYELGVARQKKKPCIIIRNDQNESELIFDIKPMSVYPLNFENPDVNFVPDMIKHIEEIIEKYYIS